MRHALSLSVSLPLFQYMSFSLSFSMYFTVCLRLCLSVLIALSVTPSALFAVYIYNRLSLSLSLCPCLFLALHLTRLLCCDKWKLKSLKGNNRGILQFPSCLWLSALIWKPFLFRYLNVRGLEDDIWK